MIRVLVTCASIAVLAGCSGPAASTTIQPAQPPVQPAAKSQTTVLTTTSQPLGPTSCPTALPQGSTDAERFIATLRVLGGDGPAIADKLRGLPVHPTSEEGLLRAWMFVEPDAAERMAAFDMASAALCSRPLVTDLAAVRAAVPQLTGNTIRHPDDLFDACPNEEELGWLGTTRVVRCDTKAVLVINYAARTLSSMDLPQNTTLSSPGDSEPYARPAGRNLIWTNVAEHAAAGLTKPTFDGTISTVGLDFADVRTVTAFTGLESDKAPEFQIQSWSDRYVLAGPSGSTFYLNSSGAPLKLFSLPALTDAGLKLPAWDGDTNWYGPLQTLLPLYPNKSDAKPGEVLALDLPTGKVVRGLGVKDASAGCAQVGLGDLQTGRNDFQKVYLIADPQGTRGGRITGEKPTVGNAQAANGLGVVEEVDSGLALLNWNGEPVWTISHDLAELKGAYGVWLVVENKSNKRIVVDSRTGKEAAGLPSELQALLTSTTTELKGGRRTADGAGYLLQTYHNGVEENLFDYAALCPPPTVPADSVPVGTGGLGVPED